jgi:hypothetical protein
VVVSLVDRAGGRERLSPALATVRVLTVAVTVVLGIYPRPPFDFAQPSAATSGTGRRWACGSLRAQAQPA